MLRIEFGSYKYEAVVWLLPTIAAAYERNNIKFWFIWLRYEFRISFVRIGDAL